MRAISRSIRICSSSATSSAGAGAEGDAERWRAMFGAAAMHARGVAHCDLRAPSNMLVSDDGVPYIVDFVARVCRGRAWNLPWNWVFAQFVGADESALAKLRVRFAPSLATGADRALLAEQGLVERVARAIGERTREIVRFFVRSG